MEEKIIDDLFISLTDFMDWKINHKDSEYFGEGIHCSNLDSCIRQVVLRYYNFPAKKRKLAENIQLEFGNIGHTLTQEFLTKSKRFKVLGHEIKLNDWLPRPIAGKLDTLAEHRATGTVGIIDVKSVRPNAFKYGNLIKDSYKIQINSYRYGAERMLGDDIDWLAILILDRSGTNKPVFSFVDRIEDDKMEEIFAKYIRAVNDYETSKVFPDMIQPVINVEFDIVKAKKSWQCDWCPYERISCPGYPEILPSKSFIVVGKYQMHDGKFIPHHGFEMIKI